MTRCSSTTCTTTRPRFSWLPIELQYTMTIAPFISPSLVIQPKLSSYHAMSCSRHLRPLCSSLLTANYLCHCYCYCFIAPHQATTSLRYWRTKHDRRSVYITCYTHTHTHTHMCAYQIESRSLMLCCVVNPFSYTWWWIVGVRRTHFYSGDETVKLRAFCEHTNWSVGTRVVYVDYVCGCVTR